MAQINLLPWREQLREERKRQFFVHLGGVVIIAVLLLFLWGQFLTAAVNHQNARNNFLRKEIAELDGRIGEINDLRKHREELLERMKIIQSLQGDRSIIGRIFEQLVVTLPDGVYFTAVKMAGNRISIVGVAESNNRISNLMRNMETSDWLTSPSLTEVKALTTSAGVSETASTFQLTVLQSQPVLEEVRK